MLIFLAMAAQASPPERFSILAPVPPQECVARQAENGDVVVCGETPELSQRLPLPGDAPPAGPVASNPHLTGTAALAAEATPCAALQKGCQVGFGQPLVAAAAKGLVTLVQDAARKKPDKRGRVPIPLD